MVRTTRLVLVSLLLVALLGGQTHAFQLTGGVGAAPSRAYVHVQESQLKLLMSYSTEKLDKIHRQKAALYGGWVVPLTAEPIDLTVGLVLFSETDRDINPVTGLPDKLLSSSQIAAPRADLTVRINPLSMTAGLSSRGLDYTVGVDLLSLGDFKLFVGYSSWSNHAGPLIGLTARW